MSGFGTEIGKHALAAAAGAVVLAAVAAGPAVAATTLKVSTCLVKNDDQSEVFLDLFFNKVNAAKAGVRLRYIGGPEAIPRKKQHIALQRKLVDIIFCPSSYYGGKVPEARVTAVSNVSPDELRANGAYDILQKAWAKGLNARILGWAFWGGTEFHIYTTFKPKLSDKTGLDLSGVKMRSTGLYNPFFRVMGAVPVNISATEVYTALERGVVKGLAYPIGAVSKYGWQRFIRYRVSPAFFRSSSMAVINLDKFNALAKSDRDLLVKAGIEFERKSGPALRKRATRDTEKLFAAGVKEITLTGNVAKAYLGTIYGAKWADNAKYSYIIPFEKLKALMYKQ